jgi:hypothetical protein
MATPEKAMSGRSVLDRTISLRAFAAAVFGSEAIDACGRAKGMTHPQANDLLEEQSFGKSGRVQALQGCTQLGRLVYEPFALAKRGLVFSIDDKDSLQALARLLA